MLIHSILLRRLLGDSAYHLEASLSYFPFLSVSLNKVFTQLSPLFLILNAQGQEPKCTCIT